MSGPQTSGRAALTFDDGPHPDYTPTLLDTLDRLQVTATFFVVGENACQHPHLLREIVNRGHEVGNHSLTHNHYQATPLTDIPEEIEGTNNIVYDITGIRPTVFRPPYGILSLEVIRYCVLTSMTIALWSLDSDDCRHTQPDAVSERIETTKPGDILLFHDDNNLAERALAACIPRLNDKGIRFTSIDTLTTGG